jgi:hypothetical protein
MGIGVRLHAQLGDEQRQRQQLNNQATATSEQDTNLRKRDEYPTTRRVRQSRFRAPGAQMTKTSR